MSNWWDEPGQPLTAGGALLPALAGQGGKLLAVKSDASGLEYVVSTGLSLTNAAADGTTKGIAAFTAAEFNASSGVISLDYTNAQAADATHKGFVTSADWITFNAKLSNPMTTAGDLIVGGVSGAGARLAKGSDGKVLSMVSGSVAWADASLTNPMTTAGDLIVGGVSGAGARLAKGSDDTVLTMVGGAVAWAAASGGTAPATASLLFDEATALVGDLVLVGEEATVIGDFQAYTFVMLNAATHADADSFAQSFFLAAGSYTLSVRGLSGSNRAKVDWYIDNVLAVSGQDWYSASFVRNVVQTASVTVTTDGRHTLKAVVNGKHASSSDYYYALTKAWLK